jgi:hypothetical protein
MEGSYLILYFNTECYLRLSVTQFLHDHLHDLHIKRYLCSSIIELHTIDQRNFSHIVSKLDYLD